MRGDSKWLRLCSPLLAIQPHSEMRGIRRVEDEHPLLSLQRLDLEVLALEALLASLDERTAIDACRAEAVELAAELEAIEARCAELAQEAVRADARASELSQRIAQAETKLYSGSASAPRELEGLQTEIASLSRQRVEREDAQLELMQEDEDTRTELTRGQVRRDALEARIAVLEEKLERREGEIRAEIHSLTRKREARVSPVVASLLEAYERLRSRNSYRGRIATPLKSHSCAACGIRVSELARAQLRAAVAVVSCDGCGRLLVG